MRYIGVMKTANIPSVRVAAVCCLEDALHAGDGGAQLGRDAFPVESLVPEADDSMAGAKHQAAADKVHDQEVVFHAGIDQGLAAVA